MDFNESLSYPIAKLRGTIAVECNRILTSGHEQFNTFLRIHFCSRFTSSKTTQGFT